MDILIIAGLVVVGILFGLVASESENKTNAVLFGLATVFSFISICLKVLTITVK